MIHVASQAQLSDVTFPNAILLLKMLHKIKRKTLFAFWAKTFTITLRFHFMHFVCPPFNASKRKNVCNLLRFTRKPQHFLMIFDGEVLKLFVEHEKLFPFSVFTIVSGILSLSPSSVPFSPRPIVFPTPSRDGKTLTHSIKHKLYVEQFSRMNWL